MTQIYQTNRVRYNDDHDRCYARAVPPVILNGLDSAPSHGSSTRSVVNEFMPPSRRASYSLLAPPPSNLGIETIEIKIL